MLFNSINFAIFLPIVFLIYWFLGDKKLKFQNILLLLSSYFFYACWDWRFLFLLIFSTFLDYYTGIKMSNTKNIIIKKIWFWLSISINIGFLGVFKYYNFFASSFVELLSTFGLHANLYTLNIILPVGISFYTFHGLSYVIDIYKDRIKAERNIVDYSLFVSFFPLLVAGPIERATHLLPQIKQNRIFDYKKAVDGLKQIFWGLFKKIVIADQCAELANLAFNDYNNHSGGTLVLGAVMFALQIYGDFSGYSDIALGTARLFGIELLRNFSYPYFSRDISEFWRRWHISLSTWFKDYLYIPLGGSKGGKIATVRNTFIIFIVSGFWHGANWTFIVWGFLNALFIIPSIIFNTNRNNLNTVAENRSFPTIKEFIAIVATFSLTTFAWIFFRSENLSHAVGYLYKIFSDPQFIITFPVPKFLYFFIALFICFEWMGRHQKYALEVFALKWSRSLRWVVYYLLIICIISFSGSNVQYIYFQF